MLHHPVEIAHYVAVRHPHKPEAFASKPRRSTQVVFHLRGMAVTVDLDDQFSLGAKEIGDERAKPDLAAKFGARHLAGAKARPEALFGRGGLATPSADSFEGLNVGRTFQPLTFPSRRDGPLPLP